MGGSSKAWGTCETKRGGRGQLIHVHLCSALPEWEVFRAAITHRHPPHASRTLQRRFTAVTLGNCQAFPVRLELHYFPVFSEASPDCTQPPGDQPVSGERRQLINCDLLVSTQEAHEEMASSVHFYFSSICCTYETTFLCASSVLVKPVGWAFLSLR